ncbi:MAG: hypothetical protein ACYDHT_10160 [Solirubrobacteraceae bacterium]
MKYVSLGLLSIAYLLAVVHGVVADKGNYPSNPGRTGFPLFVREHPWIVAGAACGVAGTVVGVA